MKNTTAILKAFALLISMCINVIPAWGRWFWFYDGNWICQVDGEGGGTGACAISYYGPSSVTHIDIPLVVGHNGYVGEPGLHPDTYIETATVTIIDTLAFRDLERLQIITIPHSITNIQSEAFQGCISLSNVPIPNSVEKIAAYAFSGCRSLTSIVIPNSVKEIGYGVFYGCENLTQVTMPYWLYSQYGVLANCGLRFIVVPDGVVSLGHHMFADCSKLRNVVLPDSLTSIGTGAFSGCDELTNVCFEGVPPNVESSAFSNVKSGAIGTYTEEHAAEWEAVIGSDGKWNGLIMKQQEPPPPPPEVAIDFNANGGTGDIDDLVVNSALVLPTLFPELSDSIGLPDPTGSIEPPSSSHKFIGWGLSADVDGINNPEALVRTTNDLRNHFLHNDLPSGGIIHLFAIWGKYFTVQFEADGGAGTMPPQTFYYGKMQKLSKNAYVKGSNEFRGWAVSLEDAKRGLTRYSDEDVFSDNSVKTLYAVWTTSVTVSFYNVRGTRYGTPYQELSPASLGDYMRWKVEGEPVGVWHRQGEFVELEPGRYTNLLFSVEAINGNDVSWMAWLKQLERSVYVHSASLDTYSPVAGKPYQYEEFVEVDVEGGTGPSVLFVCHAEKIPGQTFDPSTVEITLTYYGPSGIRQSNFCKGFSAGEWYKLPCGTYDVHAKTSDGKWTAYPIYKLNLASDTDHLRKIDLDFFCYIDKNDSLSGRTITLDSNGGSKVDPNELNVYAHYAGEWKQATRLPTPKYTLHRFKGWWTEKDGGKKIEAGERIEGAINVLYAHWEFKNPIVDWFLLFPSTLAKHNGDLVMAATMTAANGCRTVEECYELGINPEDPNDDLRITDFKMEDGKPVIKLNHTEDGSGNSFADRVRTLGKEKLTDAEWKEVPENGNPDFRFFTIDVDMP